MANIFQTVRTARPRRSLFDLSHERKFSCKFGQLVPIYLEEVVPGDRFRVNTEMLLRMAPMLAPVMHRVNVYTHFFFVPNRLVWNEWQDFITGGPDGDANPVFPRLRIDSEAVTNGDEFFSAGKLPDYLGVPVLDPHRDFSGEFDVSALPFRAYQLIYNEYYRDQNLEEPVEFSLDSGIIKSGYGVDYRNLVLMRYRAWEKDYFTSALPWAQRGGDVRLPLAGDAPVYRDSSSSYGALVSNPLTASENAPLYAGGDGNRRLLVGDDDDGVPVPFSYDPAGSLKVDMSNVSSSTINELRSAFSLQKWLERNARGGSRYVEQILSHFGVKVPDYRIQRPEYLGGGKSPVVISEVLQTSATDPNETPLAEMAGHGISVGNTHQFKKFFSEHGHIVGIMSILPRTAYQNGVNRHLRKFDRFDYYFPEFAHLGEQTVFSSELYLDNSNVAARDEIFGYQSRYAEYKYAQSSVHGDFRDNLAYWHLGRIFNSPPRLNSSFVKLDPELAGMDRIFAVESPYFDKIFVQLYNNVRAVRPMPYYGTPGGLI